MLLSSNSKLWESCARDVGGLWTRCVEIARFMHMGFKTLVGMWEKSRFIDRLYKSFTHTIHMCEGVFLPLLSTSFYTLSTVPIKEKTILKKGL